MIGTVTYSSEEEDMGRFESRTEMSVLSLRLFTYWMIDFIIVVFYVLPTWHHIILASWFPLFGLFFLFSMPNFTAILGVLALSIGISKRIEDKWDKLIRFIDVLIYGIILLIVQPMFIANIPLPLFSFDWFVILGVFIVIGFIIQPYLTAKRAEDLEDKFDQFLSSWPVVSLAWLFVGFGGGWAFLDALARIIGIFTGSYTANPLLLWTGAISGASLMSVSLLGRKQRVSLISPNVTGYVSAMNTLGVKDSVFLNILRRKGEPKHVHFDYDEAMRKIEELVPWAFGSISFFLWVAASTSLDNINEIAFPVLLLLATGFVILALVKRWQRYEKWRKTWIGCWNLLGLLSLSDEILAIQFMLVLSQDDDFLLYDDENDMKKYVREFIENRKISVVIPNESIDLIYLYTNIELFEFLERKLEKPSALMQTVNNIVDILSIAESLSPTTGDLEEPDSRKFLTRSLLFATITDWVDVPIEILQDASKLFVRSQSGEEEVLALCKEQLKILQDTPHHAIPISVKLLPIIYSFAIWLTTSLDALFGLTGTPVG